MRALWPALLCVLIPMGAEAACVVTTLDDSGAGSLRECIATANTTTGQDLISFAQAGVISLQSDLPALTDPAGTVLDGTGITLDGAAYTPGTGLVLSSNDNTIRNLTVRNFRGTQFIEGSAIFLGDTSSDNVITDCVLTDNAGVGINLDSNNRGNLLSGNTLTRNAYFGVRAAPSDATCATKNRVTGNTFSGNGVGTGGDGMYAFGMDCLKVDGNTFTANVINFGLRLGNASTRCVVSHNVFTGNQNPVGVFGGAHGNSFLFNTFTDNFRQTFQIGDTGSSDNLVAGNLIVRNTFPGGEAQGLYIYGGGDRTLVFNNTFHQSDGNAVRVDPGTPGVRIENNIFSNHAGVVIDLREPSVQLSHNDFFGNAAGECSGCTSLGAGNVAVDPGFVSPNLPNDDYHLASCTGGVIDLGLDQGALQPDLTDPLDGVRFFGPAPDLGAFESPCGGGGQDGGVITTPGDGGLLITTTPTLTAQCGVPYQYKADFGTTADALWIVETAPEGFTIDRRTGVVSWTPKPAQAGKQPVSLQAVTATDSSSQRFEVEVDCTPRVFGLGCSCGTVESLWALALLLLASRRRSRSS